MAIADSQLKEASSDSEKRRRIVWPLLVAAMIFAASSRSVVAAPGFQNSDKVAHFGAYGLLATLLCRCGRGRFAGLWALLGASYFGLTDEWHQSFVAGRDCDVWDWAADTLGAGLAVGLYCGWGSYRALLERPLGAKRRVENRPADLTVSSR
jgi:VanZ family protein